MKREKILKNLKGKTKGLTDDEQECFISVKRCINQIFTLKQSSEKPQKQRMYVGFINLEKAYDKVNKF